MYYIFTSIFSLIIRSIYCYFSWYIRDHARIFDLGYALYAHHILPTHGSPVVYSDSLLPGSLQGILAAIPLYFSNGHPYSILLFVQILNLIACVVIAKTYFKLFPNFNKKIVFAFIVLNPMNIIFSYGWNPSFMILFSALFFMGVVSVVQGHKGTWAQFLIYFPHLLLFQLNLQFLILAFLTIFLLFKRIIPVPSVKIVVLSLLPGLVTLAPFFVESVSAQKVSDHSWNLTGSIFSNIQFHFTNLFSIFHIIARFLSFSTGEVTRNLGDHFILEHPWSWIFFAVGMLGTGVIFLFSILFYLSKSKWKCLVEKAASLSSLEKMDLVLIAIPIVASISFVFSIVPPTTHKIWSLFPFCFYPFFRALSEFQKSGYFESVSLFYKYFSNPKAIAVYILSTLAYSCVGAAYMHTNFEDVIRNSEVFCKEESRDKIQDILNNEYRAEKEELYTFSLLCSYWWERGVNLQSVDAFSGQLKWH